MSKTQYAEHRGCSRRAVYDAILAGKVRPKPDGRIDSDEADAAWPLPAIRDRVPPGVAMNRAAADALDRMYKAKLRKLAYEERRRELVPVADVKSRWAEIAVVLRTTMLAIPSRLASLSHEQRQELTDEITAALTTVADRYSAAVVPMTESGADPGGEDGDDAV